MILNAYLIFQASPLVKVMVPFSIVLVTFNNYIVAQYNTDYSPLAASLASVAYMAVHVLLVRGQVFDLFRHPERRWWLISPRKQVEVLAYVSPYNGIAFKTKTFDISEGGAFIPVTAEEIGPTTRGIKPRKLQANDRVSLCLTLGLAQIRCDARVVRTAAPCGHYPAGIGLSFEDMPRKQRKQLRRYIMGLI